MEKPIAIVLLSGGLDSATCLALALEQGCIPIALSFDYGQRHKNELIASKEITAHFSVSHVILPVGLDTIGGSALTANVDVPKGGKDLLNENKIPVTYVPVRNLIFLSLAYALAEVRNAQEIFIGVNSIDYSGYPDCRPDFIAAFAHAATLASKVGRDGNAPKIITPLAALSKSDIAQEAVRLKVPVQSTWSCYDPQIRNGKYYPCENCDACILRRNGFTTARLALSKEEIFGSPQELP
ncbi:MAG TPA: 7-cyano-7-deazaguanine synthase QueC [Turneriella sp.]|nr:7-cyano-7-deazaguanine synthase QueC [Turneriella sp.]